MPRLITAQSSVLQQVALRPSYKQALGNGNVSSGETLKASSVALTTGRDEFNSGHYDHSTGRFTAPFDGVYYFCCSWMRNGSSSGAPQLRYRLNGSSMWGRRYLSGYLTQTYETHVMVTVSNLKTGDYVDIHCNDSGPVSFYGDDSYVMGFLIG